MPDDLTDRQIVMVNGLIDRSGSCWAWRGSRQNKGYGRIQLGGRWYLAHRLVYSLARGDVPVGKTLDHLCRNRLCVNPSHLEPVSNRENILRGVSPSAICAKKLVCLRGHKLSGSNLIPDKRGKRNCRECRNERNSQRSMIQ